MTNPNTELNKALEMIDLKNEAKKHAVIASYKALDAAKEPAMDLCSIAYEYGKQRFINWLCNKLSA